MNHNIYYKKKMITIGLTGGISSGKTTIVKLFQNYLQQRQKDDQNTIFKKWRFTNADLIYKSLITPANNKPSQILQNIEEKLGPGLILEEGYLNREKLGHIIFNDKQKRETLNTITHPAVHTEYLRLKEQSTLEGFDFFVYDIPLLFEKNMAPIFDQTITVWLPAAIQLSRLMARNNFTEEQAAARIASQMPLDDKKSMADFVIDNSQTLNHSKKQIIALISHFEASY